MPIGKPSSSHLYWPSLPNTLMGPMVPQSTDAVKNVFGPGHRKRMGGLSVQTPLISIYTVLVHTYRESRYVSVVMIRKKQRKKEERFYLEFNNAGANKSGYKGGNHLCGKGDARWNLENHVSHDIVRVWTEEHVFYLDVVRELEVVGERQRVGTSNVSRAKILVRRVFCAGAAEKRMLPVGLEKVHGQSVAFDNHAADELGEHVERDLDARHGGDDADGDDKHEAQPDTVQDDGGRSVRRPEGDAEDAKDDRDDESKEVVPLGDYTGRQYKREREGGEEEKE